MVITKDSSRLGRTMKNLLVILRDIFLSIMWDIFLY
jgi:hypothetical protein